MTKYYETNADVYMSLLQVRSTPVIPGLPSPAKFLFKRLANGLLLRFNKPPIMHHKNKSNHTAFKKGSLNHTMKQTLM